MQICTSKMVFWSIIKATSNTLQPQLKSHSKIRERRKTKQYKLIFGFWHHYATFFKRSDGGANIIRLRWNYADIFLTRWSSISPKMNGFRQVLMEHLAWWTTMQKATSLNFGSPFSDFFNTPFHVICCSPKPNEYQTHQVVCGLRKNVTNEGTKKKVAIAFHFYAGRRVWDPFSYINNCIELWWWNTKKQREEVWISRELLSQSAWWY